MFLRSFEMKRSRIGVPRSSYFEGEMKDSKSKSTLARYDIDTQKSYRIKVSVPNADKNSIELYNDQGTKIHFESNHMNSSDNLA